MYVQWSPHGGMCRQQEESAKPTTHPQRDVQTAGRVCQAHHTSPEQYADRSPPGLPHIPIPDVQTASRVCQAHTSSYSWHGEMCRQQAESAKPTHPHTADMEMCRQQAESAKPTTQLTWRDVQTAGSPPSPPHSWHGDVQTAGRVCQALYTADMERCADSGQSLPSPPHSWHGDVQTAGRVCQAHHTADMERCADSRQSLPSPPHSWHGEMCRQRAESAKPTTQLTWRDVQTAGRVCQAHHTADMERCADSGQSLPSPPHSWHGEMCRQRAESAKPTTQLTWRDVQTAGRVCQAHHTSSHSFCSLTSPITMQLFIESGCAHRCKCTHANIHAPTLMQTLLWTSMPSLIHPHVLPRIYVCVYVCAYAHVQTHARARPHLHTHTHNLSEFHLHYVSFHSPSTKIHISVKFVLHKFFFSFFFFF